MRNLFRGIVIKIWVVTNFEKSEDRKYNKIIVKEPVAFYNECWVDRYKEMHNEEEQKKILTQQYQSVFDEMMSGDSEERRNVERAKLDVNRAQNQNIRSRILGSLKMKVKLKKYPQADIRRFF